MRSPLVIRRRNGTVPEQSRARSLRGNKLYLVVVGYFAFVIALFMAYQRIPPPETYVVGVLLLGVVIAPPLRFVKDWIPFFVLLLSYQFMRGAVPHLTTKVNIHPLIDADRVLFDGHLPVISLQEWFYTPGVTRVLDVVLTFIYIIHFGLPLIFAFLLWVKNRVEFRNFALTLLALSYAAFVTCLLYPAMPPWMAAEQGYIPHVYRIVDITAANWFTGNSLPSLVWLFGPNPVAAMPSLHAAYPTLILIYSVKTFGRRGWFFLPYALLVWFGVVYLGHHYVIDVIAGLAYAALAFLAVRWILQRRSAGRRAKVPAADLRRPDHVPVTTASIGRVGELGGQTRAESGSAAAVELTGLADISAG